MAVNIDGNGLIALGGTSSTQGRLRLAEDTDNGTNYIELTAPASVGSDRVITFPDATTTVVGTDTTQTLTNKSIVATQLTGTIAAARLPAGSVLQVVNVRSITNYNLAAAGGGGVVGPTQLTNYAITITPSSASNKIFLIVTISSVGFANTSATGNHIFSLLYRGAGTTLLTSDSTYGDNNTYTPHVITYLDSPSTTSSVTYYIYGQGQNSTSGDYAWVRVGGSATLTAMEIAA